MHTQRRYSKRELLGRLQIDYLFSNDQLPGITPESSRWEVLAAFLKAGDARAERQATTGGRDVLPAPGKVTTGAEITLPSPSKILASTSVGQDARKK